MGGVSTFGFGRDAERGGDGSSVVLRLRPQQANQPPATDWCLRSLSIFSFFFVIFMLGGHVFYVYRTWHESFAGVWFVRANILLLVLVYGMVAIKTLFFSRNNQLPPSCFSIRYLKYRWYMWCLAFTALASIPGFFILRKKANSHLFTLLQGQIEYSLFTVLISAGFDSLSRYLHLRQMEQSAQQQRPSSPPPNTNNSQYGYFSPKSKKGAPTLTSHKSPFESGKFRSNR